MNSSSQITQKWPPLFFSALIGGCLTILCLFNLPLFYEQERSGWLGTSLITFILFSLLVTFSLKMTSSSLKSLRDKNKVSILLTTLLSLLLVSVFYFTATYYWSDPYFQRVEICYETNNPTENLKINSLSDVRVGRVFPAQYYGYESYPISIPAGTCINGGIRTVQKWQGIILNLEEKGNDDSIKVTINRRVITHPLTDTDGIISTEIISIPAAANRGAPIYPDIFSSKVLIFIKWISLIISSIYLAMLILAFAETIIDSDSEPIISPRLALLFVLAYFIGFGFLMVNHGGQPDQNMHIYYSSRFSETWGLPQDDPYSSYYIQDNEYLYYWINGAAAKLYHLILPSASPLTDKLLWRLLSVAMSAGTLYYIYKTTSVVTGNNWGGILAAFFCANTLMFVFISGGVSYDNMMSLSSAAAIYHMVRLLGRADYVKHTAGMGIWLGLGSLAKNQVALLAFIIFGVWLIFTIYNRKAIRLHFSRSNVWVVVIFVLVFGLCLEFYGGNLIKYHRPIPGCKQIKDPDYCLRFSDRAAQFQEVDYGALWINRNDIIGPFEYAFGYWLFNKVNGIWGIISHNTYVPRFATSLHGLLIIWMIFCLVRYWQKEDGLSAVLVFIVASYAGFVFFLNYDSELHYNFRHYAVQGRYLFPVFCAFLALTVKSFLSIPSLWLKRLTISLAIILYFAGGLGTFIFRYSDVFIAWRIFY